MITFFMNLCFDKNLRFCYFLAISISIFNSNIYKHEDRYVFVTFWPFQIFNFKFSIFNFQFQFFNFNISIFQFSISIFQFSIFQFQYFNFSIFNFYPHILTPLKSIKLDPIYRRTINHLGDEYAMKTPYWKI